MVSRFVARLAAQVADRLVDGHLGAQARVARVHQPAGRVLLVGEQRRDLLARRVVEQAEQLVALVVGDAAAPGRRRRRARAGASTSAARCAAGRASDSRGRRADRPRKNSSASSRDSRWNASTRSSGVRMRQMVRRSAESRSIVVVDQRLSHSTAPGASAAGVAPRADSRAATAGRLPGARRGTSPRS